MFSSSSSSFPFPLFQNASFESDDERYLPLLSLYLFPSVSGAAHEAVSTDGNAEEPRRSLFSRNTVPSPFIRDFKAE